MSLIFDYRLYKLDNQKVKKEVVTPAKVEWKDWSSTYPAAKRLGNLSSTSLEKCLGHFFFSQTCVSICLVFSKGGRNVESHIQAIQNNIFFHAQIAGKDNRWVIKATR